MSKEKGLDDFSFKNKIKNKRRKICKTCHSLYRKQHYLQNREKYLEKALRRNKKQGEVIAKYLFNILSKSQCIDCEKKDIIVLKFDHIKNKQFGIAEMYQKRYSLAAIKKELRKCVVRCANCHRRKTAKDVGFWKFKISAR